jgi:hypothetical protein
MTAYTLPVPQQPPAAEPAAEPATVYTVTSGDLRPAARCTCAVT